jgi:hypothetical protein
MLPTSVGVTNDDEIAADADDELVYNAEGCRRLNVINTIAASI